MTYRTGVLAFLVCGSVLAAQQGQSRQVEWPYYGGDPASSKYSPADDITPQNVQRLGIVWQWAQMERRRSRSTERHLPLRELAADGRWRALRDDALQQRGGLGCRDREGAVALSTAEP